MNRQTKKANGIAPLDLNAWIKGLALPGVNLEAVADIQRRNWEAVLDANRVAAEGYQTLLSRQMEIVQTVMQQTSEAMQKTWTSSGKSSSKASHQLDEAKAGMDQAIGSLREFVEIAQEANMAPLRIIQDRFNESIEEWRKAASR